MIERASFSELDAIESGTTKLLAKQVVEFTLLHLQMKNADYNAAKKAKDSSIPNSLPPLQPKQRKDTCNIM